MSIGSDIGGAEETVDLVAIVAILAVVAYVIYKAPDWWTSLVAGVKADFATVLPDLSSAWTATVAPFNNAQASASTSIDTALNDYEANTPSELGITVLSGPAATIDLPTTTPGLPAGYDPATGTINEDLVYNGGQ